MILWICFHFLGVRVKTIPQHQTVRSSQGRGSAVDEKPFMPKESTELPKGAVFVACSSFRSYRRPQLAGLRGSLLNVPLLPGNNRAQDTPKTSTIFWFFTDELISWFTDNHLLPKAFLRSGVGWGVWMWSWTPGFSTSSVYISLRYFF